MKADQFVRDSLVKLDESTGDDGSSGSNPGEVIHVRQTMRAVPIHVKFEWRIEKFDILMSVCKPGEAVISKHLFFNPAPQVVWLVYVYPNGYLPEYRDTVCVFLEQVAPLDDAKGLGLCEAHVKTRYYLIEEDGNHHWLTPGNQSIQHETVKDAMHMDGSVVIGVDFKYLPPTRLLCNDENVEMRLMSGPASMLSRVSVTKEEREKEITVDGGGVIEQAGGIGVIGRGEQQEDIATQVPVTPPNTPNNGPMSPIPSFSQKDESDENRPQQQKGDLDFVVGLFGQLSISPPQQQSTIGDGSQQQGKVEKKRTESSSDVGCKSSGRKKSKKRGGRGFFAERGCQIF